MEQIIIALDFETRQEIINFLDQFKDEKLFVKVGMEAYYQSGPEIITDIKERGHTIFLDLKLHDIPNTVERTMRNLSKMGVDLTTVHAAGGLQMMEAAKRGMGNKAKVVAVTQLTSTSEQQMRSEQLVHATLKDSVLNYAQLAKDAGLDGVVCSPLEVSMIHEGCGQELLCITPGIRPQNSLIGDQKRVTTPREAKQNGSNFIVIGRPITQADDPVRAYREIKKEWENA